MTDDTDIDTIEYDTRRKDIEHLFWRDARSLVQVFQCRAAPFEYLANGREYEIRNLHDWLERHDRFDVVEFCLDGSESYVAFHHEVAQLLFNRNKTPHSH